MELVIEVAAEVTESKKRRKLIKTFMILPFRFEFFTGYSEIEMGNKENLKKCIKNEDEEDERRERGQNSAAPTIFSPLVGVGGGWKGGFLSSFSSIHHLPGKWKGESGC